MPSGKCQRQTGTSGLLKQLPASLSIGELSGRELAYLGDVVYELYARLWILAHQGGRMKDMHRAVRNVVSAPAQAEALGRLWDDLSAEERQVVTWGRNSRPSTLPRSVDRRQYLEATGLEALVGYLYLTGEHDRLDKLMAAVLSPGTEKDGGP